MARLSPLISVLLLAALVGCASPGPLVSAAGEGNADQVSKLLAQGADVNGRDPGAGATCDTPLTFAASKGQNEMIKLLLKNGAVVEQPPYVHGITPLWCAAVSKQPETVQLFLDSGAKTDPLLMRIAKDARWIWGAGVVDLLERANAAQSRPVPVPVAAAVSETPPHEPSLKDTPAPPAEKPWWEKGDSK